MGLVNPAQGEAEAGDGRRAVLPARGTEAVGWDVHTWDGHPRRSPGPSTPRGGH